MRFVRSTRSEGMGFQLAPMIDVVFLLLCFFVTSQLFAQWEAEIDVALPTAKTGQTPQRLPGEIILNILKDGSVVVNGRLLNDQELGDMLKRLAELFPGQPVVLRADRQTAYENIIKVLDRCREADIWNISFATLLPEE